MIRRAARFTSASLIVGTPLMKPAATSDARPRRASPCARRKTPSLVASWRRSPWAASRIAVPEEPQGRSVAGSIGEGDLVPHIVFSGRARHRQALDLGERRRIIDYQRALVFPDRDQRVTA